MKTLAFLQSAPLVGPIGWVFGIIALAAMGLLVRLWYSMSNKERIKMERLIKVSHAELEKERTARLHLGQRADDLAKEKRELEETIRLQNKRIGEVEQANDLLRDTENKQSMLISALTERCKRNEKLIIKLYNDLGKTIDLGNVGGDEPETPGTSE